MPSQATASGGGAELTVELERDDLLPGRLVAGRIRLVASRPIANRGLLVTLVGVETWQYEVTERDAQGHTRTRTVTQREELPRVPVEVVGPGTIEPGTIERPFELPVPPLGPASQDATVARVDWIVEAKLDLPRGFDLRAELPVRLLQPTALLRAGVVRVEQFALWESADAEQGGHRASIRLRPVPLCMGAPFTAEVELELARATKLQELRLELRVNVRSTVARGKSETLTPWVGQLAGPGSLESGVHRFRIEAALPAIDLPTIELPHGRTDAEIRLVVARPLARDPNLVRDVAVCTTTEL